MLALYLFGARGSQPFESTQREVETLGEIRAEGAQGIIGCAGNPAHEHGVVPQHERPALGGHRSGVIERNRTRVDHDRAALGQARVEQALTQFFAGASTLRLVARQNLPTRARDAAGLGRIAACGDEEGSEEESFTGAPKRLAPWNDAEHAVRRHRLNEQFGGGARRGEALGGAGECGSGVDKRAGSIHSPIVPCLLSWTKINTKTTELAVTLADGRKLAYFDLGDSGGHPVIHSHGAPSGKLETAFFDLDGAAKRARIRLIAVDRPGIGGSDPAPGRTLLGWADDIAAFADALGLDRFGLFGYSIGGASALACLHRLHERVTAATIVSGVGPADVAGIADGRSADVTRVMQVARSWPGLTSLVLSFMKWGTKTPEKMIAASGKGMPAADRAIADRPESAEPFAAFIADALRNGTHGVRDDLRIAASPWGFTPSPSAVPVSIWHGTADTNVPVATAHWLARVLPEASLTLVPDGGHISVLDASAEEILVQLAEIHASRA